LILEDESARVRPISSQRLRTHRVTLHARAKPNPIPPSNRAAPCRSTRQTAAEDLLEIIMRRCDPSPLVH
jgi:hypothetical protein